MQFNLLKRREFKRAFGFLARNPDENQRRLYMLKSNRDISKAIQANDALLDQALDIGDELVKGRSKPTLSAADAAAEAFKLLVKGWPSEIVIANLDRLQSGEDREGGSSPIFIAADQIQKDSARRERASLLGRLGAVTKAFILHEQGVKAVRVADIRAAMKPKVWVDPTYPDLAKAAE